MNLNQQDLPPDTNGQSPGWDPKTSKRNSGLFAFLKWFKPSTSRESIETDVQNSHSSSCDSLNSIKSTGTVASFSYVSPSAYRNNVSEKCIVLGPETDTYKARLKQRDKRRENDKNLTLRKKYNLFFNKETLLKAADQPEEENTKSLPLMPRSIMQASSEEKVHRRTNSESSKIRKAGAYLHVKGKRKAPQPPGSVKSIPENCSTMSLRRKKRLAPAPPTAEKVINALNAANHLTTIEYADADVICNDSLKLDHGILKSAKETDVSKTTSDLNNSNTTNSPNTSARSSYVEAPVSPRPWYKRNTSRDNTKKDHHSSSKTESKYEPIERLPDVQYMRNSTLDLTIEEVTVTTRHDKKKEENKRKSGITFLTNISELDREAKEILKKEHEKNGYDLQEIPEFMRPKDEPKINTDSWVSPKRRSARDLIAKFNAITSVTKVTVFGVSSKDNSKRDFFGKQQSLDENKRQESLLETHKKRIEQIDKKIKEDNKPTALMKSESASAIKHKPETPKADRKSWKCPKCFVENDYWRIICHVCSAIKPYFDDFAPSVKPAETKSILEDIKPSSPNFDARKGLLQTTATNQERILERSRTQIGFSALASYNANNKKKLDKLATASDDKQQIDNKKEEREKLKKMLIEMKNSLPKRKSHLMKQNSRTSIIMENPESDTLEENNQAKVKLDDKPSTSKPIAEKTQEEKVAEILKQTIYENIKAKKPENPKPFKVSSSAQTSGVVKKTVQPSTSVEEKAKKGHYELMRPKDFEDIYSDKNGTSVAKIYANLAQSDELSLFFNMPKRFSDIKNNIQASPNNTDTIEINRLLRRLETAIAKGELTQASIFAKELAQLKINCSVIRQKPETGASSNGAKTGFQIEMFVEDKVSHRGPFPLQVTENKTVADLKRQVEKEFEIPVNVQRWILGKELVTDDGTTLKDHNITTEGCPVFLYLVAPDPTVNNKEPVKVEQSSMLAQVLEVKLDDFNGTHKQIDLAKSVECKTNLGSDLATNGVKKEIHVPKIVSVVPKTVEIPVVKTDIKEPVKLSTTNVQEEANNIKKQPSTKPKITEEKSTETKNKLLLPPKAKEEDFEEYESKTLKPLQEWECQICTLLNPLSSNVCGVCAAVRQTQAPKRSAKKKTAPQPNHTDKASTSKLDQTYLQLVNLDNADLVENTEIFECVICFMEIAPKEGVTLRECLHQFCKTCLGHTIEYTEEAEVKCPYRDSDYSCNIALQDREIKALVSPLVYEQYLARSVAQAENKMDKSFHCKTPDCKGWCIFEDNVNDFRCPVCKRTNCLTCQAIHTGMNCKQYQEKMNDESEIDDGAKQTKEMLEEMVNKGEALTCPTCKVVLMKKWGCDWLRCSMCKTEICWVTRGPRWGPAGKGDTSGGCQCGVNGVKCHPQCNYCH